MKRFLFAILITALLLVSCHASAESAEYETWPKLIQALQDAGRETGNILASEAYPMDKPETAVFLVQAGDTAQLTVLESENGAWRITAQNDTIPVSIITDAKLTITSQTDPGGGWIKLELEKYIPSNIAGVPSTVISYFSLDFQQSQTGEWVLFMVCDVPFDQAWEGRCPYHLLCCSDGIWEYRFYEEITDGNGWWERSEIILRKPIPAEEMPPSLELSRFDYPSFLPFLRSMAPEEYEHAPTVPPLAAPAPDPDAPAEKSPGNVYYNPYGGRYFHVNPECSSVSPKYFPLTAIAMDDISSDKLNLLPCPYCTLQDRVTPSPVPIMVPSGTNVGESILKAAAPAYGDNGLTTLMILMNTPERQAFILESFPPYCYLDADYDGNVLRILWYPEMNDKQETPQEPYGERWSMTFEFIENTWQLTSATNGRDWMARAEQNVYTFDDYNDHGGAWLWSAAFETRLTEFDYAGLEDLVELYNEAMPDRPSLR